MKELQKGFLVQVKNEKSHSLKRKLIIFSFCQFHKDTNKINYYFLKIANLKALLTLKKIMA